MDADCSNIFGHKFPDVSLAEGTVFHRVDCGRKHCNYAMDAVAFKRLLDKMPEDARMRKEIEKLGPRITMHVG